jgi:hypothetical protein
MARVNPMVPKTEPRPSFAATMPDGRPWPRISIVTPNFNYADHLETTLCSVIDQGYPNLEYIVIDDGSTDSSVEIIRRYAADLSYWETGPNRGHGYAVARGLERCSGDIFNWICSDDHLAPDSLRRIAMLWSRDQPAVISGSGEQRQLETGVSERHDPVRPESLRAFFRSRGVVAIQPSTFLGLEAVRQAGGIRPHFRYLVDWDLYARLVAASGAHLRWAVTSDVLAVALSHGRSQTATLGSRIGQEYLESMEMLIPLAPEADRRFLERQIERARAQQAVAALLADGTASAIDLVRAGLQHPRFMMTRFYAGALRRKLAGTMVHA